MGEPKVQVHVSIKCRKVQIITLFCIKEAFLRTGNGVCYQLVGVVIHHRLGSNSGHYTSYFLDRNQKQWFYADDLRVKITGLLHNTTGNGQP